MVSHDAAHSWKPFSPDLTTEKDKPQIPCGTPPPAPAAASAPATGAGGGRGAPPLPSINDFAISTLKKGVFWTVSSNGQIYNTMDSGAHWNNVSNIADAAGVSFNTIEAGHTDVNTAYLSGRATSADAAARAPPTRMSR